MIFIMSNQPGWLKVDIPSNRIVSYITYPLSILSAIGIVEIIYFLKKRWQFDFVRLVAIFILSIGIISGLKDISESARNKSPLEFSQVFQTYLAAIYLNNVSAKEEMVLKDHVNLPGDTWMKIFFMRGYEYPLSRTYDKRYNDVAKTRETCTRDMVAIPDSEIGKACFDENKVKFIVLEKGSDDFQFESSPNFSKIYNSSNVVIFQRK